MSRVLVTGAGTPLGDAIVRRLLADPDWEVRALTLDVPAQWLRESCETRRAEVAGGRVSGAPLEGCSHVLALGPVEPGVRARERMPYSVARDATLLVPALLRDALEDGAARFLYVGSALAADNATRFPSTERHIASCPPPRTALALAGLAVEDLCRAAQEEHGLALTICRPFGGYGPGERAGPHAGTAHVVADLAERALAGERPLQILGDGSQRRVLTHFDDLADGIVAALAAGDAAGGELNVAGHWELTVSELARLVWRACGHDEEAFALRALPAPAADVARRAPSVRSIARVAGWRARITPAAGVAATVDWLRAARAAGRIDHGL
ncbi:MAG TPA: NAD(P)-dependent oxidoreductase [Solirubrobacteraceae bacterium]|nr:NAD(P)-dependent oxidoreductase [Solirubrobacteraceae bacterium]